MKNDNFLIFFKDYLIFLSIISAKGRTHARGRKSTLLDNHWYYGRK